MLLRPEYLSQALDRPLPTKDGGTLRTIRDACDYMTSMDKKRELRTHWQRVAKLRFAKPGTVPTHPLCRSEWPAVFPYQRPPDFRNAPATKARYESHRLSHCRHASHRAGGLRHANAPLPRAMMSPLRLPTLNRLQPSRCTILEFKLTSEIEMRLANKLGTPPIHPSGHFHSFPFRALVSGIICPFRPKMLAWRGFAS
jgi:hypothetical protein